MINSHLFLIIIGAFVLIIGNAFGQESDSVLVKNNPVKLGYIKIIKHTHFSGDPSDEINITSKYDTVINIYSGQVKSIFIIDSAYYIVVKSNKKILLYGNLRTIKVHKNSLINKGEIIGLIKPDENNKFLLTFTIANDINTWSYFELLAFFKERIINPYLNNPNFIN